MDQLHLLVEVAAVLRRPQKPEQMAVLAVGVTVTEQPRALKQVALELPVKAITAALVEID